MVYNFKWFTGFMIYKFVFCLCFDFVSKFINHVACMSKILRYFEKGEDIPRKLWRKSQD